MVRRRPAGTTSFAQTAGSLTTSPTRPLSLAAPASPPQRTNDTLHRVSGITYSSEATPRQGWIYGCGAKRITNAGCRHLDGNTSAVLEGLRTDRNLQ